MLKKSMINPDSSEKTALQDTRFLPIIIVIEAQPTFPCSPNHAPIGGLEILAVTGGAMAVKKFADKKKK